MAYYNVHTHLRREGEVSILNVFPEDYSQDDEGYISCGYHPWYLDDSLDFDLLEKIIQHPNVVAIGECGYDRLRGESLEIQKNVFEKHVELSETYHKPLIIHCVKAWDFLLSSYKRCQPQQNWIIHGFRGKPELLTQLLLPNILFSIGLKFNAQTLKNIPLARILCETDDENVEICQIYASISDVLGLELTYFQNIVSETVKKRVFVSK